MALIASADWGHAHQESGPYGYHPASAHFDNQIVELIRADDLDQFLYVDVNFAIEAKVDGLWQTIVLAGAAHYTPMHGEVLAPTYFGMIVATYTLATA